MAFEKQSSKSPCHKGPAAWSALWPSLLPLAPTTSIESTVVTATNQPEAFKPRRGWLHLPNWAFPLRPVPLASEDDESVITLDIILAGRTKSPIRIEDFRAFLQNTEHVSPASSRSLEFLLTYNSYRAAFFALPPNKQAPHPVAARSDLSLANKVAEVQARISSSDRLFHLLVPPQAARTTHAVSSTLVHPERQPLRQELHNIIDLYLQPHSLSSVSSLVPSDPLLQALSLAKLTTHPSALDPIASRVHSHLTTDILPQFLDHAVANLSAATSRGRMLVSCIAFAAAVVLEVFLIMYKTGRPARLLAMPLWILAIGYAIGSQTSLCFWLALRGAREHKSYEGVQPSLSPNEHGLRMSSAHPEPEPQRPRTLLARLSIFTRNQLDEALDRSHSVAEKGELPSYISKSAGTEEKRPRKLRKSSIGDYPLASPVGSTNSTAPLVESKNGLVKKLMRLTGTAVDTVVVEDSRIRKLQAMVGVRVAIWLILGTSVVIGIVMAIP